MRCLIRVPWVLCLAVGLLLCLGVGSSWQAGASGNVLFVAADGAGATCSAASPCALETGLALAVPGDRVEVVEGSGSFGTALAPEPAPITVPAGVTLSGHSPAEPGEFFSEASTAAVELEGGGAAGSLNDIHVENLGSGDSIAVGVATSGTASVERVMGRSAGGGAGCAVHGESAIVDSVCAGATGAELTGSPGAPTEQRVVNATIIGSGDGIDVRAAAGGSVIARVSNSILQGGARDIFATGEDGPTEVAADHSNFSSAEGQAGATVSAPGSSTNQTAAPLFVDAAAGDFREQSGSPTVDAGASAPESGSLDIAGNDRVLPGRILCFQTVPAVIDLGAYEFVPVAPPCVPPVTGSETEPEAAPAQPMVRIPRLVGLNPTVAVKRLRHLQLRVRLRRSSHVCLTPKAKVVRAQRPSAGKLVPKGTAARLRLGCG